MSQPVKISEALLLDARKTAEVADRSIAGQIEHWARLGRAVEPLLQGDQVLALKRAGEERPLSACLEPIGNHESRRKLVREHLASLPFPHFEQSGTPGVLVKINENGQRTFGRFVKREFKPIKK